jgi:purine nucleosidase
MARLQQYKLNIGETYILGDSPLVLLTALQSSFEADPSSSTYVLKQAPKIDAQGAYAYNHAGRTIRVYTQLDIPLLFDDFFAKLELMNR